MLENSVSDIVSLLSSDKFEKVELVANEKQDIVDVYPAHCMEADLRKLNILRRNEDLDQDFIDFLEISHDLDNMIMIRKLKRWINDIRQETIVIFIENQSISKCMEQRRETTSLSL